MPVDQEVLERIGPEAPTALELEWKDRLSTGDFSAYFTKLELICEEAKQNLVNIGLSPVIQNADCVVGVYTASGDLALASAGCYLHVCTGIIPVKYILKHFRDDPSVGVRDGDSFFCNEVLYGGLHNQDMLNIVPVFWEEGLVAWVVAGSHEPETGAVEPGGWVPFAQTRYEEGLKVPPLKVGEQFQLKTDLMDMVANMVRDERVVVGDLRVRTACCYKVRERLLEVVRERGAGFLVGLLRRIVEVVAEGAKERVRALNDGTYRHLMFFDQRGRDEALGRISVALIKKGDEISIDLSGTSPPTRSYLNSKPHVVRALLLGELMQFMFSDFPESTGLLAPFRFSVPQNTIMNAPDDHAMSGSLRITAPVVSAILVCFAKLLFDSELRERAVSPPATLGHTLSGGGTDQYGNLFSWVASGVINGSGAAATSRWDGMDASQFWFSGFNDCLDVEHEEVQYPFLCLFRRTIADQAGYGKYRGGAGLSQCFVLHRAQGPARLIFGSCTTRMPHDPGIMGGYYGGLNRYLEIRGPQWQRLFRDPEGLIPFTYSDLLLFSPTPVKVTELPPDEPFRGDDTVALGSGSSGGYGDVLERDTDLVMEDLRRGVASAWTARHVCQVAFDEATLQVDRAGTERLRQEERQRRKQRGRPYAEFARDWLQRKPSAEVLRLYGPWPGAIE